MSGPRSGLLRNWLYQEVEIPNASSLSSSAMIAGRPITSLIMPSAWTVASLSFMVSGCPGGEFFNLLDGDGIEVSVMASASVAISASKMDNLSAWYGVKLRSGSLAAEKVDQGAARTLIVFSEG